MLYSPDIKRAMLFAYNIHKKQFDLAGYPYIHNVLHIAEQMNTEKGVIVALLHDVLEDSGDRETLRLFSQLGFDEEITSAVYAITRGKGEKYSDYIARVSQNKLATSVKIKDLEHNIQADRLGNRVNSFDLMTRYERAYDYLISPQ